MAKMKRSQLRIIARAVLANKGFQVTVIRPGQGNLPGSRLIASKGGKKVKVAVRVSHDRALSFTKQPDGKWRTLGSVDMVVAVVPAESAEKTEVMAFDADELILAFDRAWQVLNKTGSPAFDIPTFIPLGGAARKNVGHDIADLQELKLWVEPLSGKEVEAIIGAGEEPESPSSDVSKNYIDVFIRRYAKANNIDEGRVFIGVQGGQTGKAPSETDANREPSNGQEKAD